MKFDCKKKVIKKERRRAVVFDLVLCSLSVDSSEAKFFVEKINM